MNFSKVNLSRLSRTLLLLVMIGISLVAQGQKAVVFGVVQDLDTEKPIDFVTIYIKGTNISTESDATGNYRVEVDENVDFEIVFSRLGYAEVSYKIKAMSSGRKRYVKAKMAADSFGEEIIIRASKIDDEGMVREEVTEFKMLPSASGNFESILPNIALGVSAGSGGELSSQYNVRGGNYDENLIYVNGFEIFRPQIIRSGQQEGLSFPNVDLIRDLTFSSGGYHAKYGDKMASVLDVNYKIPEDQQFSVSGSLLGASAHMEGSTRIGPNAYNKLRYLVGTRYKTNRYLLGSLDVAGEYVPNFIDLQTYLTYDFTKDLQLGFITNYNSSQFDLTPESRETALGLITFALRLSTNFEGFETNRFVNGMTGLSLTYLPDRDKNPLYMKLLASRYSSSEEEKFDIIGRYRLAQIETDLGSDDFGQEVALLGTGTQHSSARNYLYNEIYNIQHKGGIEFEVDDLGEKTNFVEWGAKIQTELYEDALNEWERLDSAGYSLPYIDEEVGFQSVFKSENIIENTKFTAFAQNTYSIDIPNRYVLKINAGVRFSHLMLSGESFFSPRGSIQYKPLSWDRDMSFKLSGGIYHQSPFYRELRRLDGSLNRDILSQRAVHLVGGMTYDFKWLNNKTFRFITEAYYKKFDNLITYDQDNVRIRYAGDNNGTGYATGLDMRVNGEFVPGAESWVNLSFMRTGESINGIDHMRRTRGDTVNFRTVKYVPRPTDRFATLNMFFQDYLPSNENFKVNVNFAYGTGLPFGIQGDNEVFRNTFRFKTYHRVDIGFAYQLWNENWRSRKPKHPLRGTKNAWLSLEVFNLLEVENTASNTWIKTITNDQYAIPDRLTSRRINLRFRVEI